MKKKLFALALIFLCLAGCSQVTKDNTSEIKTTAEIKSTEVTTSVSTTRQIPQKPITTTEVTTVATTALPKQNSDFVRIKDYIPDIYTDLRYATTNNFTKQKIYDFNEAWLRYGTVKKLMQVQNTLKEKGFSLKIWDAFRPVAAQFKLWEVYPDSTYVANPNGGYSSHSYGNTIDLTMVKADGTEIKMPTDFDNFSTLADRNYRDCDKEAAEHAMILESAMEANGFTPYYSEWWHYSDYDNNFGVDENFNINQVR